MADHTLDMLHSAIRAMEDVVLPTVDRRHPLALEQATLVTRILQLLAQRLPLAGARQRFELRQATELAEALQAPAAEVSPAIAQALAQAAQTGRQLLVSPDSTPAALQAATRELGGLAAVLVEVANAHASRTCSAAIEHAVLQASAGVLAMQRAWFLPQGWEPDPSAVPPLERLLGGN